MTNCFCIPHKETSDQVEAEIVYASDVYELNRRVNPSEAIVGEFCTKKKIQSNFENLNFNFCTGWWATGHAVTNHSSVIHEYYARECVNPIHLTLDTSLHDNRMGLKAYVCVPLGVSIKNHITTKVINFIT